MHLSAKIIYDVYCSRADAEYRVKEVKYDFGVEGFNGKDIGASEAAVNFVMKA